MITFKVNFNHIDPNDWLDVSIICEQDINMNDLSISPTIEGKVAETMISRDTERLGTALFYLTGVIGFIFIFISPILLLDIKYDFMPSWFVKAFSFFYPFFMIIIIVFYFGTRQGRHIIFEMLPKTIWNIMKIMIKKTLKYLQGTR